MDGDGDSLAMSYLSTNTDQTSLLSVSSHDKSVQESQSSHSTFCKNRSLSCQWGSGLSLVPVFSVPTASTWVFFVYCLHELRASEVTFVSNTLVYFFLLDGVK